MRIAPTLLAISLAYVSVAEAQIPPRSSGGSRSAKSSKPLPPPKPANGDAPLAEGWPDATQPGKIEVKKYPAYRSAVARAKEVSAGVDNVLFWPLFVHISRKGVEMTAPVVNTYSDQKMIDDSKALGSLSMEFVYPSTKVGTSGQGVGAVKVEDHPARTYVCYGIQGGMDPEAMRVGRDKLMAWLAEHKNEWVLDGEPRRLGYHGPMTPTSQRLWEVQLPIRPVDGK